MTEHTYNKTGTKELFPDCPHKGFANRCRFISTGNVWDSAYTSNYIRQVSRTECNGRENKPGRLRKFDYGIVSAPSDIQAMIDAKYSEQKNLVVVHVFNFGFVAYINDDKKVTIVGVYPRGGSYKTMQLLDWFCERLKGEKQWQAKRKPLKTR